MQTKRGARPEKGSFSNIEAIQSPFAPRGRWARSSRTMAEAENELDELNKMLVAMKLDHDRAKNQYELALNMFEKEKRRAYSQGWPVSKGVSGEYLRAYRVLEDIEARKSALEFKISDCQRSRTAESDANESPSEDFPWQPTLV